MGLHAANYVCDLFTPLYVQRSDVLLYVGEAAENFTVPISVPSYSNLQVSCSIMLENFLFTLQSDNMHSMIHDCDM